MLAQLEALNVEAWLVAYHHPGVDLVLEGRRYIVEALGQEAVGRIAGLVVGQEAVDHRNFLLPEAEERQNFQDLEVHDVLVEAKKTSVRFPENERANKAKIKLTGPRLPPGGGGAPYP